jgi:5-methylcytosine-specific restriction enzyme B
MTNKRMSRERHLSGQEIGLPQLTDLPGGDFKKELSPSIALLYDKVRLALQDGFAGVILVGPPGTGKSHAAHRIAREIATDEDNVLSLQFHPSYQYEDFVEGYVPDGRGNFEVKPKKLLLLCEAARLQPDEKFVLLIDEISRSDVTRVFGEALTYLEPSKRDQEFTLQYGTKTSVPRNLVILGTMNPWDRGIDELDWAIERRFAKLDVPPDGEVLAQHCQDSSYPPDVTQGILRFFKFLQDHQNPQCKIGHAYFMNANTYEAGALKRLWEFQLSHHLRKAFGRDHDEFERVYGVWKQQVEHVLEPRQNSAEKAPTIKPEAKATSDASA